MPATAAPKKPAKATAIRPETPAAPPPKDLMTVRIDDLTQDKTQDRRDREITEAMINSMGESLGRSGQLQPIGVNRVGDKMRVIWGHLRIAAALTIGWETLQAQVFNDLSDEAVRNLRLIENAQRLELNPVEQTEAVAKLLDLWVGHDGAKGGFAGATPDGKKRAIAGVAGQLGMAEPWVRDRAYMARLAPAVREIVLAELLPLSHAREISKVVDHGIQLQIAKAVAANDKGDTPADLDHVRHLCAQHLYTLATVAWRLDVPFAGKPACVECPLNSVNQPGLFASGVAASASAHEARCTYAGSVKKEPEAGICTGAACYLHKTRAASSVLSAASGKIVHAGKGKAAAETAREATSAAVAKGVKASAVNARVKARAERSRTAPSTQRSGSRGPSNEDLREEAEDKLDEAMNKRAKELIPQIHKALERKPGAWSMLKILQETKLYKDTQADGDRGRRAAMNGGLWNHLVKLAEPSFNGLLTIEKDAGRKYGLFDEWYDGPSGVVELVAKALGIAVDDAPTIEDFLPKKAKGGAE
jgi:hypothetical protein